MGFLPTLARQFARNASTADANRSLARGGTARFSGSKTRGAQIFTKKIRAAGLLHRTRAATPYANSRPVDPSACDRRRHARILVLNPRHIRHRRRSNSPDFKLERWGFQQRPELRLTHAGESGLSVALIARPAPARIQHSLANQFCAVTGVGTLGRNRRCSVAKCFATPGNLASRDRAMSAGGVVRKRPRGSPVEQFLDPLGPIPR